jgi:hypothetical protein
LNTFNGEESFPLLPEALHNKASKSNGFLLAQHSFRLDLVLCTVASGQRLSEEERL